MATTPIVTYVTKAQLDALVAANGLNEGLQYNVTDIGYVILATSNNAYMILSQMPYKKWVGILTNNDNVFNFITLENTFDTEISWIMENAGVYLMDVVINPNKIHIPNRLLFIDFAQAYDGQIASLYIEAGNINKVYLSVMMQNGLNTDNWGMTRLDVEIREYY